MIHAFISHGYPIVLDVYSGSVHLVDEPTLFAIQTIEKNASNPQHFDHDRLKAALGQACKDLSPKEAADICSEIQMLIDDQVLFTEDSYRDLSIDLTKRKTEVKALCLNVAHTCNLNCDYCFASQGKYHGERAIMPFEVAKQAIDFLIAHSGGHRVLDVDFFGGEPLLNWDVVKKTVAYADELGAHHHKKFRYTFTTNGLLLDEEVGQFLNAHMHNVVLSLDGRPEVHDRLRHTLSGQGSYDLILPKFQAFVKSRGDQEYYVRGTFTGHNKDFCQDIIHMANLGFHRLSMEPVIGDPAEPYMLQDEDLPLLEDQYDQLTCEMLRRDRIADDCLSRGGRLSDLPLEDQPFLFYHFMMNLEEGPCIYKRISGCGSGTEYMAVTPWGDLYPCHQFVGEDAYLLGNVFDGVKNEALTQEFKQCNCYARSECQDCWAKLYCSGGCAANALHATGKLTGTLPFSCALFRKRMECALTLKVDALVRQAERDLKKAEA